MADRPRAYTFVGISGSLRRGSTNTALLAAARELAAQDVEVVLHPLHRVPFFDADVAVQVPRARQHVDGGVLVTPRHRAEVAGLVAALRSRVLERSRQVA